MFIFEAQKNDDDDYECRVYAINVGVNILPSNKRTEKKIASCTTTTSSHHEDDSTFKE